MNMSHQIITSDFSSSPHSGEFQNIQLENNNHNHNNNMNNNIIFSSFDETNSIQSQNYNNLHLSSISILNQNKIIPKNIQSQFNLTNTKNDIVLLSSASKQASDFFYVFNIIPINLNYMINRKNFSFLSELNREIDICETNLNTQIVSIFYSDIILQHKQLDFIESIDQQSEKNSALIEKLKQTIQITNILSNQISYSENQQKTFQYRSKNKKEKRMFALSSSYNSRTSKQSFSIHFSTEMIHTLGYDVDSFFLNCSITGFNEFIMRNEFLSNMEVIIEGMTNQILTASESQPIQIKQKFCKNQDEAMEAVFAVYMLKDPQLEKGTEQIIVFEIQHIIDFQVSTKKKQFLQKKRQPDLYENRFIENYFQHSNHLSTAFEQSNYNINIVSQNSGNDTQKNPQSKKKYITKQTKNKKNLNIHERKKSIKSKNNNSNQELQYFS